MTKQLFFAFILLVISVAAIRAQGAEQAAKAAREQFSDIKNRSIEMERMKRQANKRPPREDFAPKFPEIKEDFEQIQKLSADLVEITDAEPALNYPAVSKLVTEINRRASRLQSNLFAPGDEQKKETKNKRSADEAREIKTLLKDLDKSVVNFVHNAMFQNVKVVNSQDSLDAQTELENIVKISHSIKEKVKNLNPNDSKK